MGLARNPDFGTLVEKWQAIWMVPAADVFPKPYSIFYTFSDTHVYLLSIRESSTE